MHYRRDMFVAVATIALMGASFVAWYTISEQTTVEIASASVARGELSIQQSQESLSARLESVARDTKSDRARLNELFVGPDPLEMVSLFDSLSRDADVRATISGAEEGAVEGSLAATSLGIDVSGSYDSITKFIRLVESSPKLILIRKVTVARGVGSGVWNATLQVTLPKMTVSQASKALVPTN